ncbi:MAG: hypothetical protein HYU03_00640 [Thaumarchaeota archaeon]|nr:hypothetical protein [Nitrososphaerota archaeon]MBI3022470.1 hypothetical protein [Nitrososphaerota archaeon]MCS4539187.1 hypothetical protein [Nitrososphaerota archaeon]
MEVSCFIHATEDEGKVAGAIASELKISGEPHRERLDGHFGNEVIHLRYHLTGEEAWIAFSVIADRLGRDNLHALLQGLDSAIDEHSALFLRFSKQDLVMGRLALSASDPIRVRVKPRQFMIRGDVTRFYGQLLERSS